MSQPASFRIGARTVGAGRAFVIAEAGVNHNGDLALAHRLVDAAADAGADAVKFQVFDPTQLVAPSAPAAEYQSRLTGHRTQLEMLQALTLPKAGYAALQQHARERGIDFMATPFDEASADFLAELGVPALKFGSGELTNHALLAHGARLGRPLLVSTGMSTLDEVAGAVGAIRAAADVPLALFHCVSNYPAKPADCNLEAMRTMRDRFGVPVGWSDHTLGLPISLAAVAMGAELIEKHLTLDRAMPGPDHEASLEPASFGELISAIREIEQARGDGVKVPAQSELPTRAVVRRSLHARASFEAGHVLAADDVIALRPEGGVPAHELPRVLGRRLKAPVAAGQMLRPDDLA